MKNTEELLWILDREDNGIWNEEESQLNIEFVHSLGLKCDSVGWSRLDLSSDLAPEVLNAIERFCQENGWNARGWYTRKFAESESDWYTIRFDDTPDNCVINVKEAASNDGRRAWHAEIKAYLLQSVSPKGWSDIRMVPDRFRKACADLSIDDVDFCWAKDNGKYAAEQYFHIYPKNHAPRVGGSFGMCWATKGAYTTGSVTADALNKLGGSLPRLSQIFGELHISLPICCLRSDLPDHGFAHAHLSGEHGEAPELLILVHKDTAAALINEHALTGAMLEPFPVSAVFPDGYRVIDILPQPMPSADLRREMFQKCEKLLNTLRPAKAVSEKDALTQLRRTKKLRQADFGKPIPKSTLPEADAKPLMPYYLVANGGELSDEYRMLAYEAIMLETARFKQALASEGLMDKKPEGIVFAKCPDGDVVALLSDGTVARVSHEAPEIIAAWSSLSQFISDALMCN